MAEMSEAQLAAERLRERDPERWATLCRMHLSFLLDLKDDDFEAVFGAKPSDLRSSRKTLVPFVRKHKDKGLLDRSLLTRETLQQAHRLIRHLNQDENLCHEGLFRKSGKLSRQHDLKIRLHSGLPLNLENEDYSVHDCASVLKNFLADLPEPLLTEAHYPAHCQIPDLCPDHLEGAQRETAVKRQIQSLQLLFHLLPSENRNLLQDLLLLLNRVAQHDQNRMDPLNLGTVFAPHILCPRKMVAVDIQTNSSHMTKAVALMVQHALVLFDVPENVADDALMHWKKIQRQQASSVESIKDTKDTLADNDEVDTCITFCDRDLASRADAGSTTAAALAELYAYIQTMPDAAAKSKYVKRFGKENGASSPCIPTKLKYTRSRSLGTSIKKHLFRSRKHIPANDTSPSAENISKEEKETTLKSDGNFSSTLSASLGDGLERRQACLPSKLRSATVPEFTPSLVSATSLPDSFAWGNVAKPSTSEELSVKELVDSPGASRRMPSTGAADTSVSNILGDQSINDTSATTKVTGNSKKQKSARHWRWENPKAWVTSWLNHNSKVAGKMESVLCSCKSPAKTKTPKLTLYRRLDVEPIPVKFCIEKKPSVGPGKDDKSPNRLMPSHKTSISPLRPAPTARQPRLLLRTCRSNSAGLMTLPNRTISKPVVCRSFSSAEIKPPVLKETCV